MANDNAASRLLQLLLKAKSIDGNSASSNAWEQLLDAKRNHALLLSRMGKMIALPDQIASALSGSVDAPAGVTQHISSQFYSAFTTHKFGDKWEIFSSRIDPHILNYLVLASALLETQQNTTQLEADVLRQLRDSFTVTLDEVIASEISPKIRSYIVKQLHALIATLDDYFITGAEAIVERIEAAFGHAFVDPDYKDFLQNHDLGRSVLECLSAAANVVTVAVGIPQLAHFGLLLLQQTN